MSDTVDYVSIHAPVRERPVVRNVVSISFLCFNSRSREGATFDMRLNPAGRRRFNSRSREGATSDEILVTTTNYGFNSRSREGATEYFPCACLSFTFQFTLP